MVYESQGVESLEVYMGTIILCLKFTRRFCHDIRYTK